MTAALPSPTDAVRTSVKSSLSSWQSGRSRTKRVRNGAKARGMRRISR